MKLLITTMTCEGETKTDNKVTLSIHGEGKARVQVMTREKKFELQQEFNKLAEVWDGHMTGLITAPGLSIKYEKIYGKFRNVVMTTDVSGNGSTGSIEAIKLVNCR